MVGKKNLRAVTVVGVLCAAVICASFAAAESEASRSGVVTVTIEPVRPYQIGDFVWTTTPPDSGASRLGITDTGCDRVPATGYIGTNVYAESGAHYANYWSWGQGSSGQPYYWYVKRTDGTTQTWGYTSSADNSSVPANIYRWKVQNQGATPQAWNVCFDVT